ncbi:hypothetical protein SAMN05444392_12425 [Seinonella peptonophila]|uniref:Uncharacterized protein n=1 Tax=Seinonella peptonophila TaxID=112248 RepID=A0A1M5BIN7_9BACL|nr:hypothetical protein [Seinonella peptonophila]SHF42361.1 hypothetical protein SAMN05444392_12425 [Seinonella peptonophila]
MKVYQYEFWLPVLFIENVGTDLCSIFGFHFDVRRFNSPGELNMFYDGVNRNNFVLLDYHNSDSITDVIVRCEEKYQEKVRHSVEYWDRIGCIELQLNYFTGEDAVPKNKINDPESKLPLLLHLSKISLDNLYEKWGSKK